MGIIFDRKIPPLLLLFTIFECMWLTTFSDDSNPLLNGVQLVVSKVLMFHENTELFPSSDSYDISPVNNDPTKRITLFLVGIPIINQLFWVELVKEEWEWGINRPSLFLWSVRNVQHRKYFLSVKIALATLKLMYLNTYRIFFNALSYGLSVKGSN